MTVENGQAVYDQRHKVVAAGAALRRDTTGSWVSRDCREVHAMHAMHIAQARRVRQCTTVKFGVLLSAGRVVQDEGSKQQFGLQQLMPSNRAGGGLSAHVAEKRRRFDQRRVVIRRVLGTPAE